MFRYACRKLEIVGNIHVVVMNSKGILVKKNLVSVVLSFMASYFSAATNNWYLYIWYVSVIPSKNIG